MSLWKLIFNLHLILGLVIGLLLVSAGLTGSVLVWKSEIDALLHRELLRVEPGRNVLPLQAVVIRC